MPNPLQSAFSSPAPQVAAPPADPVFSRNQAWAKPGPWHTPLDPMAEGQFKQWVLSKKVPYDLTADPTTQDYDMRGFWKAAQSGDPLAQSAMNPTTGTMHFPDNWKTPYHESFSAESQYALPSAPRWKGDALIDGAGNTVFQDRRGN